MNGVIYYSNTGQSKLVAQYFSQKTAFPLFDICDLSVYQFDTAILVFPVHCQNIPNAVKRLLDKLKVKSLAVIATYGKICYGNVLYEIQNKYRHNIIAAAYVPTKHSYLVDDSAFTDFDALAPIISKLSDPAPVSIGRAYKNPFAGFCMGLRSRMGVKLYKDSQCDSCGVCNSVCKSNAIDNGKPNRKCIRCLKCLAACPRQALHFKSRLPMRMYLRKRKIDRIVIIV